jgi:betaine reductase
MVKNAIYGLACAKACGVEEPSIGILNLEGARQVERALRQMKDAGYPVKFGTSVRSDGGCLLRGNDLLVGSVDVVVTDSLTGNVLMKVLSAFTSGGDYETVGYGYGPGVGRDCDRIVCILSRASGAPVVANALKYAAQVAAGNLLEVASREIDTAIRTGFAGFTRTDTECVKTDTAVKRPTGEQTIKSPAPKAVTEEITGIDILELEDAATLLLSTGVYAETGMGCTGPVVLVAVEDKVEALRALKEGGYIE